jgi:hypothetical protein
MRFTAGEHRAWAAKMDQAARKRWLTKEQRESYLLKAARFRALARLAERQTDSPPVTVKSKSATVTSLKVRLKGQGSELDRCT